MVDFFHFVPFYIVYVSNLEGITLFQKGLNGWTDYNSLFSLFLSVLKKHNNCFLHTHTQKDVKQKHLKFYKDRHMQIYTHTY